MNSKISFIIPIYNVEKYIEKCVDSIIKQTYKNIEIILIDDGSTDNSAVIIDKIAKTDSRIRVFHKTNGGVSSARNYGLKVSEGNYILFIDGDDYIEPEYAEYFYNLINTGDYDIAYNSKCFDLVNKIKNDSSNSMEYSSSEMTYDIYVGGIGVGVAVWNKMYRKEFLDKHNICFDENIWYGEGMLFNIICLSKTKKVIVGDKLVYHQIFNPNSAMRNFNLKSNYCGIKSLDIQKEFLNNDVELLNAWNYHKRCFNMSILIGIIKSGTIDKYNEDYKKCIKNLRKNILVPLRVKIPIKTKFIYMLAIINPVYVAKWKIKNEKNKLNNYKV